MYVLIHNKVKTRRLGLFLWKYIYTWKSYIKFSLCCSLAKVYALNTCRALRRPRVVLHPTKLTKGTNFWEVFSISVTKLIIIVIMIYSGFLQIRHLNILKKGPYFLQGFFLFFLERTFSVWINSPLKSPHKKKIGT